MLTRISKYIVPMAVLLLGACASSPELSMETLEQRVQGRWDVVIAGDYQAAYQYFSPGLRQSVSYENYLRSVVARTVRWTDGQFKEILKCDESVCKVQTTIHYEVSGLVPGGGAFKSVRVVIEDWIQVDETWYFVPPDIL
jgi:hypothetical protein